MIEIHTEIIEESGGEKGILYRGELEFVSEFLKNSLDLEAEKDIFRGGTKLIYWIISGHPFIDGNKRTGIECADIFLRKNGYYLEIELEDGKEFALKVAKDELTQEEIRDWIIKNVRKD